MNGMSRENWSFGVQIVSAIGILVIAVATFINSSNKESGMRYGLNCPECGRKCNPNSPPYVPKSTI